MVYVWNICMGQTFNARLDTRLPWTTDPGVSDGAMTHLGMISYQGPTWVLVMAGPR